MNRVNISPLSEHRSFLADNSPEEVLVVLYGDLVILSYIVEEDRVTAIDPISLSSRCSVVDVYRSILCSPLVEGTVMIWSLHERRWDSIGVFPINSLRVTGITIVRYPTIVLSAAAESPSPLATWEGNVVVVEWNEDASYSERSLSIPLGRPELSVGGMLVALHHL